jgi:hypothetical protein
LSEGSQLVSSISIVAATVCLALGIYVMLRNPYLKSSKLFMVLASIAALASLVDYIIITAPDEAAALTTARPLIFFSVLLAAMMLYMTAYLPYERERSWLVRHKWEFAISAVVAAAVPALSVDTVAKDSYGWWISMCPSVVLWYAIIGALYLAGIIIMARLYREEKKDDVRHRIIPPTVAMALPIVFALILTVLMMGGNSVPPDLSMAILASSILFVYGIFKQKLFILKPTKEGELAADVVPVLRPGQCVLVEATTDDHAYCMFVNEIASGGNGISITPVHPDKLRERYGMRGTPVLWLTEKPGPDSIDPSSINVLTHTALQYLQKSNGSVVLLDGLDYLRLYNRPEEVMNFFYRLKDAAVVTGSKLIVTVNPEDLGERVLPLLERELDTIRA